MNNDCKIKEYEKIANNIRKQILSMLYKTKSPHIGSSFSCVETLVALYYNIMSISPENVNNPCRDRFIFSKGHACPALYSVLSEKGFIKKDVFAGFAVDGGTLEHHPTINCKWGIEFSSGSLGHGLSVAAGMAYAAKKDNKKYKIYALLSDGELNEGSTWEPIMFSAQHKLNNLVTIVDYNKMQALGFTKDIIDLDPLAKKWELFGWEAKEVDGHSFEQIIDAFETFDYKSYKPKVIIAHTIKGKGVSFMENNLLWHYRPPNKEEYEKAIKELSDA